MKKKEMAEKLRAKKLFNEWGITKDGHPSLYIRIPDRRDVAPRAVVLFIKGRRFKDTAWYQDGSKWFAFHGVESRKEALKEAFAWIAERYPKMKMVTSPFNRNAWIPEEDLNEALKGCENENC